MNANKQSSSLKYTMPIQMAFILSLSLLLTTTDQSFAQRRKPALGNSTKKQEAKPQRQPAAKSTPEAKQSPAIRAPISPQKKDEFAPENVLMTVKGEGIQLIATWFPPIVEDEMARMRKVNAAKKRGKELAFDKEPGKTTSPFILVHDWGRNRGDLFALGKFLQSKGHAVIIPDLRGHGQSVDVLGMNKKLNQKDFRKAEMASAVGDIDQCKRFLQEKNNDGILNIDLLNVVAVGDSAHLAIAWTATDWSWQPVAGIKQGQDVKSLILFSPSKKFAGSSLKKLAKEPLISGRNMTPLPMLVVWGKQSESAEDCARFVESIRKFRPKAPAEDKLSMQWAKQNLFDLEAPTGMKGFELAGNPQAIKIWDFANDFVSQKVIAFKEQCPWQIRGAEAVLEARDKDGDQ